MHIKWQGENVDLLSVLYELVQDPTVIEPVRQILRHGKNALENGQFDRHVIKQLKDALRIFALKGELNTTVTTFLTEISRKTASNTSGAAIFDTLIP
ncbi:MULTISPECIES: bacteriocin immunity protein [unclassified Granulicatella]|uniref:bacteriocin immunity protein n=1 Tax=unclassified Granulicatella TaxID=2630493 RepID=UPI001073208D|nr:MULTISPECIES: bacteriocin immunity protein [unclassified Granulicatella]MBF0780373.1 bacteriocin immunity protein [Granulicatella sp. 19428wC4_WM01]TFU95461.1 hypothetical protein E4T68_04645 [Granulicatella sp. WM01]